MRRAVEILFVDDNEVHARILRDALERSDVVEHRVRIAPNGRDALDRLMRSEPYEAMPPPDLVLLDLDLPVVSGLDVLAALEQSPALRTIPVVVLTRSPRPEDVAECYARGANSVVERPIRIDAFEAKLRDVVRYWTETNRLERGGHTGD
jgi:CheY-like chemotaxis protein